MVDRSSVDNAFAIEGAKLASLFCTATAAASNAPLLVPIAGLGCAAYAATIALDTLLTGHLCPFPLSRMTVGDLLLLCAGKGRTKRSITWDQEYASREGLDEPVPVFRLEPTTIDVPVVPPVRGNRLVLQRADAPQVIAAQCEGECPDPFELDFVGAPLHRPIIESELGQQQMTQSQANQRLAFPSEKSIPAPRNVPPPPTDVDSASDLGQNPQSAIVAGVPGAGKGVYVSNALRELKRRNPHITIFAIDPKADPKETGYWSVADKLWRKDFEDCSTEDAALWYMDCVREFRAHKGPKLLVSDEGTTVLTVLQLCKVYEEIEVGDGTIQRSRVDLLGEFKKFLVSISGMGDSREAFIWIVCQVINCKDLGLTGGVRSIFRSIALVSPKNRNAVSTFFSTGFVPLPPGGKDALYEMMESSPCNRAFYDGKTDRWQPTPRWVNHSGFDRDTRTTTVIPDDPWTSPDTAIANPSLTPPPLPLSPENVGTTENISPVQGPLATQVPPTQRT